MRRRCLPHPLSTLGAIALGTLLALASVGVAAAQEGTTGDAEVGSGVTTFGIGDWFNLGLRLALVVAVIWAAVYGMRWYVRRMDRGGMRGGLRALEVIETHSLGPNRTLHLVRLGDRAVLVGATQERITQLLTIDDPDEFRHLTEVPDEEPLIARGRPRTAAGAMSLLSSLRLGVVAMRERQSEMNAHRKAQREGGAQVGRGEDHGQSAAEGRHRRRAPQMETRDAGFERELQAQLKASREELEARTAAEPDLGTETPAKQAPRFGALRGILGGRERGTAEPAAAPVAAPTESRESLFDRALASIDAVEVTSNGSTAAGAQARASYGRARPPIEGAGRTRAAQIADLQRAIAAARKSAS